MQAFIKRTEPLNSGRMGESLLQSLCRTFSLEVFTSTSVSLIVLLHRSSSQGKPESPWIKFQSYGHNASTHTMTTNRFWNGSAWLGDLKGRSTCTMASKSFSLEVLSKKTKIISNSFSPCSSFVSQLFSLLGSPPLMIYLVINSRYNNHLVRDNPPAMCFIRNTHNLRLEIATTSWPGALLMESEVTTHLVTAGTLTVSSSSTAPRMADNTTTWMWTAMVRTTQAGSAVTSRLGKARWLSKDQLS